MGSEWQTAFLTDLYDISSGLSKSREFFGSGFPFVAFKDVMYNFFLPDELSQLVQSTEKEQEKCSVNRGDVFLTRTSETMNELGMSSVAIKDYEHATFNGFTKRLRPKSENSLVPEFVAYYLRSPKFRSDMRAFSTMSTRASLNNDMISRLTISFPNFTEQKAIGNVLKTLDDKIELNRRMNKTLESMSRELFKSWFVDFDVVIDNALAAGSPIPEPLSARAQTRSDIGVHRKPLPRNIQDLFPSSFVFDDETGWVPEGWESLSIAEMVESISDTYPLKTVDEVVFLNTGDVLDGNFLHDERSSPEGLPGQAKKSIQLGDILFSEIRPKNKRHAFVDFDASEYVVSTKLMVLRSVGKIESLFTYFLLKQESTIRYLQMLAESRSGTFPQITYTQLETVRFTLPADTDLVDYFFSEVLSPNFKRCRQRERESKTLTKLRDTLLPQLLSGELRIPDAEKLVAGSL